MNLSELFIKRPVTTTLVMLGIMVFGTMAYRSLPVSDLPAVDFPTIQVNASLPGASPETMASTVALPLEKQFAGIAGLSNINSTSQQGTTNITLQFDLSRNIDAAAQDVQAMIGRTARSLPPQMPAPPSYQKSNPGDQSIILLVLRSATLPLSMVDEYAQQTIAQRLSMVDGVAQVDVFGSQKYAVRIDLDPRELASRGIGIDQVANAVTNANSNVPTGTIYGEKTFTVQTNGALMRAAQYGPTIVAYRNGNPVRLDEVAHVFDGVENDKSAAWQDGERCVMISIRKQPGTNVVEVVDRIKALLPAMREQLPAAMSLDTRNDRSATIRESVRDVKMTLLATIGLVVLVIFLFLRNVSATVIPSLALPASLVGTFTVMYMLNYSLDNLSLMALTLSVGFVVDDAIVMLENIVRHMEMGKDAMTAAYDASKEIAFTILSMTISLAAVFIPVLFMGGIVGRLLHEFSVTIGVAILVSGFVSISLTPMLCSRFLRPPHAQKHGWFYNAFERMFDAWLRLYDVTLRLTLRHRAVTMLVSVLLLVGTVYLFTIVPKGFLPSEDQGRFMVNTEAAQGISYDDMSRHQMQVAALLAKDPNVYMANVMVGAIGNNGGALNTGRIWVELKPRAERNVVGRSAHREPASEGVADSRHPRVHDEPAADQPRLRPGRTARALPVHAAGHRHRRALQVRAGHGGEDPRDLGPRRRQQRPAPQEPAGHGRHGPQQGVDARPHGEPGGELAVQRLRHAAGLADLRAEQSVPGHPAGRAGIPEGSRRDVAALRPVEHRHADPARIGRETPDRRRSAVRQPLRAAAGRHDLVQPEARLRARRRGRSDQDASPAPTCPRPCRPASRAPRRRSRTRCRASASSC